MQIYSLPLTTALKVVKAAGQEDMGWPEVQRFNLTAKWDDIVQMHECHKIVSENITISKNITIIKKSTSQPGNNEASFCNSAETDFCGNTN